MLEQMINLLQKDLPSALSSSPSSYGSSSADPYLNSSVSPKPYSVHAWLPWVILLGSIIFFFTVELLWIRHREKAMTFMESVCATVAWLMLGGVACTAVFFWRGEEYALYWLNGYVIEWVLSVDNLMVFHFVFNAFNTPPNQLRKALVCGLLGAILLRFIFFFLGVLALHALSWITFVFGAFLIWTGIMTLFDDDDTISDPRRLLFVKIACSMFPVWPYFDSKRRFFIKKYKLKMVKYEREDSEGEEQTFNREKLSIPFTSGEQQSTREETDVESISNISSLCDQRKRKQRIEQNTETGCSEAEYHECHGEVNEEEMPSEKVSLLENPQRPSKYYMEEDMQNQSEVQNEQGRSEDSERLVDTRNSVCSRNVKDR